jgi:large subunit ribosomal protein L9
MQVILQKQIKGLGKIGEIVKVADGYARNYLFPKNFAIRATNDNMAKFEATKQALERKNQEEKTSAESDVSKVKDKVLIFVMQSASDGRLFGSVSAKLIAQRLSELSGLALTYANISLSSPIKSNGVYNIQVSLHPEVNTEILISIAKTDSEAEQALDNYKSKNSKSEEETSAENEIIIE